MATILLVLFFAAVLGLAVHSIAVLSALPPDWRRIFRPGESDFALRFLSGPRLTRPRHRKN